MAYNPPVAWQQHVTAPAGSPPSWPPMAAPSSQQQNPPDVPVFPKNDVVLQNGVGPPAQSSMAAAAGADLMNTKNFVADSFMKKGACTGPSLVDQNAEVNRLNNYMQRMQIDPSGTFGGIGLQQHPPPPVPPPCEIPPLSLPTEPGRVEQKPVMTGMPTVPQPNNAFASGTSYHRMPPVDVAGISSVPPPTRAAAGDVRPFGSVSAAAGDQGAMPLFTQPTATSASYGMPPFRTQMPFASQPPGPGGVVPQLVSSATALGAPTYSFGAQSQAPVFSAPSYVSQALPFPAGTSMQAAASTVPRFSQSMTATHVPSFTPSVGQQQLPMQFPASSVPASQISSSMASSAPFPQFMPGAGLQQQQPPPFRSVSSSVGGGPVQTPPFAPYGDPNHLPSSVQDQRRTQPPPPAVSTVGAPQRPFAPIGTPSLQQHEPPFAPQGSTPQQPPRFMPGPTVGFGQPPQPPPFMRAPAIGSQPAAPQFMSSAAVAGGQPPMPPQPQQPTPFATAAGVRQSSLPAVGAMGGGFPPGAMPPPSSMQGPMGGPAMPGAAAAARRLDPNLMPSATKVIEDDRKARCGIFPTGCTVAELPPLATTDFVVEDNGNCSPRFMRSTLYNVPVSNDLVKQTSLPMGICICPVARLSPSEKPLPVVNFGDLGPVRCHRCKAYMCPFMEFFDGGRHFKCPICTASTEVPTEYFAHLDYTGRRIDYLERPELHLGSYEFVATKEYCKDSIFPKPPAFIFMIDVSYNAVHNGIVGLLCQNLKSLLRSLPKDPNCEASMTEVGFITYDHALHFYDLKSSPGQLKMLVVNDVSEMFVPLEEGFLVKPSQAEAMIDLLAEHICSMFADNKVTEVVLGPVIQAGIEAFKALGRPGKAFVFHSILPVFDAPGKLKNRDDRKLLATEKEKTILTPQSEFYSKLAQDCVSVGCCVDMFLFPNSYVDVATIGSLCGLTGGQIFKYQYFQPEVDGPRFLADLRNDIEKPILFDAVMRLRTSSGIRPTEFFGSFFMSNTTDVEMAAVDCDKCVTIEIKHDDKIEGTSAFFQAAILYTSVSGERRIRIHNLCLATAPDFHSLYRSADIFAVVNFLSKEAERTQLHRTPREARETLVARCAQILATYRQYCSPTSSMGQLVLPETLKLLPLFTIGIIKHDALSGGSDLSTDDRAWLMQLVPPQRVFDTVFFFYPRLIPVQELDDSEDLPESVRCSYENLNISSAYILENGVLMFLWIGAGVSSQWLEETFGVSSLGQVNSEKNVIPEKDNVTSRRLRRLVMRLQHHRPRQMKLFIVKQKEKLEPWFRKFLVEDNAGDSFPSYVDFLCQIHKEIRSILS